MTATIQVAVKRFRLKIVRAQTKIRRNLAGNKLAACCLYLAGA